MQSLNPKAFGLASGTVWGAGVALLALVSMIHGSYGSTILSLIGSLYVGLDNTVPGALFGALWGFVDGFIGGYAFAWLYNRFLHP
jgi:hypothetical protein